MKTIAQFAPYQYVEMLGDLRVPGYEGYPGGQVSISQYLSANAMFGGNSNASVLRAAVYKIAAAKGEAWVTSRPGFERVFTGQGSRENFIETMSLINRYQSQFVAEQGLKKYFGQDDFLQAMIDDKCFGLDCIGFVGTYLVDASLEDNYVQRRPLDYTAVFKPVKSLDEVTDYSAVMLTNGMHIQMIDTVNQRGNGFIQVDLCQSSSGGPQTNLGVTIRGGGGDYLPVEAFRQALATKSKADEYAADNAQRQSEGKPPRDYESYLRATMTQHNQQYGFCGGAIFTIMATGDPRNPVSGSVYIGTAGVTIKVPN
jgi:hypothetical protein